MALKGLSLETKPLTTEEWLVRDGITQVIVYCTTFDLGFSLMLASFDLVVYFVMDRIKAGPKYLGKYQYLAKDQFAAATETELKNDKKF